jgi:PAS domain S-box-containing protein
MWTALARALSSSEDALLARVLRTASEADCSGLASMTDADWRVSVLEPVRALAAWLQVSGSEEPRAGSALEAARTTLPGARRQRVQGIPLDVFLACTHCVRTAVLELVGGSAGSERERQAAALRVLSFFDAYERAACADWASLSPAQALAEMQAANRRMTNERARYFTVFQSMAEPAYLVDRDMRVIAVNTALEELYGVPAAALLARPCREVLSHSLCDDCPLHRAIEERLPFSGVELQIRVRGENRTVLMSGSFLGDVSGQYAGGVVLLQDITQRKITELALRASEERYRTIFETAAMLIMTVDESARVLDCNTRIEGTLGYGRAEVVGRSLARLIPRQERERAAAHLRQLIEGGLVRDQVYRMRRKDGTCVEVRVDSSSIRHPDGTFEKAIILIDDITAQRSLEAQLLQSQKMEAIGRLAGGVAHDFNNLLTVIMGGCTFLHRKMAPSDPMRGDLQQISQAAQRAALLTRQLLAVSRRQVLHSETVDLNAVIREVEGIVRRLIGQDVELTTELAPELALVRADPTQLEQVLMNLAVNARDAMPAGGKLRIRTSNVTIDSEQALSRPGLQPGPHLLLEVSDTGVGMDEETRAHIYEPFFTTKVAGTGLGLSTAYGIVRQSGGAIGCESAVGAGTVFTLWLPSAPEGAVARVSAPLLDAVAGSELVLVVEDEPLVRELACEALRSAGFRVLPARDGPEALRVTAGQDGKIDLVLTDVVMPGMSGRELAERLRRVMPQAAVLFMSGYAAATFDAEGVPNGARLLRKPFTPEQLAATVREVLDQGKEPLRKAP